ncbi:extracellular membrane, CFEM domain containing protein [Fusarium agapanthi]|uniref:Extracellular membrane, CFEM domain containing protein n=1 Tax=Fusarium agapanthi TaxID=1803897 RepID=A0A9P5BBA7_9HYPO|nr:extracellular membrane, CFEM domain containing protein [Fusarium agapanthi]
MKYSFAIAALATAVSAQSLSDVPKCAIPCLDDAITSKTDCKTTDLTCVCKSFDDVRSAATSCVITKCGSDVAINEVLPATEKLCSGGSGSAEESSKADTTKVETSTKVVVTTSAVETTAVETTAVETTTVPPVVESKTTAVPPVIETPTTKSEAAGGATSTPAPSGVGENSAAGLKGLGAMAMAALMALAL